MCLSGRWKCGAVDNEMCKIFWFQYAQAAGCINILIGNWSKSAWRRLVKGLNYLLSTPLFFDESDQEEREGKKSPVFQEEHNLQQRGVQKMDAQCGEHPNGAEHHRCQVG